MEKYFSYDPEFGVEFHETAEQAEAAAISYLDEYRHTAAEDGWHELTDRICWGQIKQSAKGRYCGIRETDGELFVEFELMDVGVK